MEGNVLVQSERSENHASEIDPEDASDDQTYDFLKMEFSTEGETVPFAKNEVRSEKSGLVVYELDIKKYTEAAMRVLEKSGELNQAVEASDSQVCGLEVLEASFSPNVDYTAITSTSKNIVWMKASPKTIELLKEQAKEKENQK